MPNVFGTIAAPFIVQRALELTFKKYPVLSQISLNLSNEAILFNQNVYTRILAVPPVTDFAAPASDVTTTDVAVKIDQFKQVEFVLTPQEYTGSNRDFIEEQAEPVAVAIAKHLVGAVAALWTIANFPTGAITETVANSSYATLVSLRKSLNDNGVSAAGRFVIVNGSVWEKFLADPILIQAYNNRPPENPVVDGQIRGIAGFEQVLEYPELPTTGAMSGFAGAKSSSVYVGRVAKNPQEVAPGLMFPGAIRIVTEPGSGMSVMVTQWIDPMTHIIHVRASWMYGVAKGDPKQGAILKTA